MKTWISVEDQMPKSGETVLVGFAEAPEDLEIDYVEVCVDRGVLYFANYGNEVTHWMAIPALVQGA